MKVKPVCFLQLYWITAVLEEHLQAENRKNTSINKSIINCFKKKSPWASLSEGREIRVIVPLYISFTPAEMQASHVLLRSKEKKAYIHLTLWASKLKAMLPLGQSVTSKPVGQLSMMRKGTVSLIPRVCHFPRACEAWGLEGNKPSLV